MVFLILGARVRGGKKRFSGTVNGGLPSGVPFSVSDDTNLYSGFPSAAYDPSGYT